MRKKVADRDRIFEAFHNFDNNIEFTVEIAKDVARDGLKLKFIPVLDVHVTGGLRQRGHNRGLNAISTTLT